MKLSVIGARRPLDVPGRSLTAARAGARIDTIVFMINNPEKLACVGGMGAAGGAAGIDLAWRFVLDGQPGGSGHRRRTTRSPTMRGAGIQRVDDETAALELGLLGQETTGAAGFSFAMRSVPALAEYCELVRRYAKPGAKVFNFTNPAGLVSQALRDMGYDFTFGICDAPSGMLHAFAKALGERPDALTGVLRLNHLELLRARDAERARHHARS